MNKKSLHDIVYHVRTDIMNIDTHDIAKKLCR